MYYPPLQTKHCELPTVQCALLITNSAVCNVNCESCIVQHEACKILQSAYHTVVIWGWVTSSQMQCSINCLAVLITNTRGAQWPCLQHSELNQQLAFFRLITFAKKTKVTYDFEFDRFHLHGSTQRGKISLNSKRESEKPYYQQWVKVIQFSLNWIDENQSLGEKSGIEVFRPHQHSM